MTCLILSLCALFCLLTSYGVSRSPEIYPSDVNVSNPLYFGLMTSKGGRIKSSGVVPAIQVALDLINNNSLLGNYSLHYVLYDTQCNRTQALNEFFTVILNDKDRFKLKAIIGADCSSVTLPISEISHYYHLPHISCISSDEELSDKIKYKEYYQLVPSEGSIAQVFAAIVIQYEWTRATLIIQDEPGYTAISESLVMLLKDVKITKILIRTRGIAKIETTNSNGFFNIDTRIHILLMGEVSARQILCQAFAQELKYPKYIFLLYGTYMSNWWNAPSEEDLRQNCTSNEREQVIERSITAANFQFAEENEIFSDEKLDVNMTRSEIRDDYRQRLNKAPNYFQANNYSSFCFDAAWSLALAIKDSLKYNKGTSNRFERLSIHLKNITFKGYSGQVEFNSVGIRKAQHFEIRQYRNVMDSTTSESVQIATLKCSNDNLDNDDNKIDNIKNCFSYLNEENNDTVWTYGVPYDGRPHIEIIRLHSTISIVIGSFNLAGIICSFICIIFNYAHRKRKIIRLSSPNINYIICVGCIFVYFSNVLLSVQPGSNGLATSILCILNVCFHSIGYTLAFVTILAKLGRIYLIFKFSNKKISVKDKHLLLFICLATSVPVVLFTIFIIYSGNKEGFNAKLEPNVEKLKMTSGIYEIETSLVFYKCVFHTNRNEVVVAISYCYIFILQLIALWLAFQIRKVKITGLNDSRYIAAIVYINSVLVAINIVVYFTLANYIKLFAMLFGTTTWIYTTVIVGLVFIPKMISLCKNPQGNGIFVGEQDTTRAINALATVQPSVKEVEEMKQRIDTLEKKIKDVQQD